MAWIFLSDLDVAAGAPITVGLMRRLRDNPLAVLAGSPTVPPEARIIMGPGQVTATLDTTKALSGMGPLAATSWTVPPKLRVQAYTAPGSFVVPAGVTEVAFEIWGGGGNYPNASNVGGGGGYAFVSFPATPGETFTITPAGASGTNDGLPSTVSASGGRLVTAYGGLGTGVGAPRSTASGHIQGTLTPGNRLGCAGGLGCIGAMVTANPGAGGHTNPSYPANALQRGLGRVHVFWMA